MKIIVSAVVVFGLVLGAIGAASFQQASADEAVATPAEPVTRTAAPVPPPPAPAVPVAADALPPVVFTLQTTVTGAKGAHIVTSQHVTRTRDRVRLVLEGQRKEWLFQRNGVDRDRVSGVLIDHDARQLLAHSDTELRSTLGLRGWADVVMMRFDPAQLATLRATSDREMLAGQSFSRYVAAHPHAEGIVEVWWSDTLLLPLRLAVRTGGTVLTTRLTDVREATDQSALAPPSARFPGYEALDIADADDHRP